MGTVTAELAQAAAVAAAMGACAASARADSSGSATLARSTLLAIAITVGAILMLDWAEAHLPMADDHGAPWTD